MSNAKTKVQEQDKERNKRMKELARQGDDKRATLKQQMREVIDMLRHKNDSRFQLQSMHLQRRAKMHQIHKELLVKDLMEKQQRSELIQKRKEDQIKSCQSKNMLIRDMVNESVRKEDYALKPIKYEDRFEEWKIDVKRQKKVQKEDK